MSQNERSVDDRASDFGLKGVGTDPKLKGPWNWHPDLPLEMPPLFDWPPRPLETIKFLLGKGFLISQFFLFALLAMVTWFYFLPPLNQWATFSVDWIVHVFILNTVLSLLVAGGLHLYFHTWKKQGTVHKYDRRELARKNKAFLFNNQVLDNMFWSLTSGTLFWTGWQVLFMWLYANGLLPWSAFSENPIWFIVAFIVIAIWESMHFYFVHRMIHWPPLYRVAHALHHRNVVIGPWSGLSMHPIEHFIYFSTPIIHLIIASHPIHLFYHMYITALGAYTGHVGYEDYQVKGKSVIGVANFFHTLHHRYFECNYGTPMMPWDKWLGTMHNGSAEDTALINQRRAKMYQ